MKGRTFKGEFRWNVKRRINKVMENRKMRARLSAVGVTLAPASVVLSEKLVNMLRGIFSHEMPVAGVAGAAIAAGIVSTASASLLMNSSIRRATLRAGVALRQEALDNRELREFLQPYKYVIIDRKGRIKGTNRKRMLGMGRLRLGTKKILNGKYKKGEI